MVVIGAVKDFIGKPAPPGYVAGLGRGAVGFTTRADIGPGRDVAQGETSTAAAMKTAENDIERYEQNENEEGLLGTGPYDREDEEADRIYAQIDAKMEERRRARREARERMLVEKNKQSRPQIQEQFVDLKRDLASMSADDWANIPEPGDLVAVGGKAKRAREKEQFFTATSDILLDTARSKVQMETSIPSQSNNGMETPIADFRQISKARDDLLKVKLDQAVSGDSSGGKSTVDPKGYLSGLNSVILKSDAEIGDIKRAKELLKSVVTTNPKHAPGWIAAARVDEIDGKRAAARAKLAKACEECPKNEDVWLEAARLNKPADAKIILANAVREIPTSVKIWMQACALESDVQAKKKVVRKSLEYIPNSVTLWKAAIELENDQDDARIMLSRAVECVPQSVELWLALAKLETYKQARIVLNCARKANPTSYEIWIAAAQLEESAGNVKNLDMIINKAVSDLTAKGANLSRENWIKQAVLCEGSGSILTCQAIIRACLHINVDEEEREEIWLEDAKSAIESNSVEVARAIFSELIKAFPKDENIWLKAAQMEKAHGNFDSLDSLLESACKSLPHVEIFWLMRAKERWQNGSVDGARVILGEAFSANPDSEDVWLAAVKLETENGEYEKGRLLLQKAREKAGTERVWLKSAVLERNLGNNGKALGILETSLVKYPKFAKLWMISGQIHEQMGNIVKARECYAQGVRNCPNSVPLWLLSCRLEVKANNLTRARALLDKARLSNPQTAELWLESVRIEMFAKNESVSKTILAKALQECPKSGILWAESIFMEARPARKSRSVDALKKCDNDSAVVVAVGRLFWQERNIEKARSWLNRAVKLNSDIGDSWAWLYRFELEHALGQEMIDDVVKRCVSAEPCHGELWTAIAKDPKNFRVPIADILKMVAAKIEP